MLLSLAQTTSGEISQRLAYYLASYGMYRRSRGARGIDEDTVPLKGDQEGGGGRGGEGVYDYVVEAYGCRQLA